MSHHQNTHPNPVAYTVTTTTSPPWTDMHLHEMYAILTQQRHSHLEILINYILCNKYFKMFMIFNSNRQGSCFTEIGVAQDQLPQHLLSLSQNDAVATFFLLPSSKPPHLPYSLLRKVGLRLYYFLRPIYHLYLSALGPLCWCSHYLECALSLTSTHGTPPVFLRQTKTLSLDAPFMMIFPLHCPIFLHVSLPHLSRPLNT